MKGKQKRIALLLSAAMLWMIIGTAPVMAREEAPAFQEVTAEDITVTSVTLRWDGQAGADVEYVVTTDDDPDLVFDETVYTRYGLEPDTEYTFRLYAVEEGETELPEEAADTVTVRTAAEDENMGQASLFSMQADASAAAAAAISRPVISVSGEDFYAGITWEPCSLAAQYAGQDLIYEVQRDGYNIATVYESDAYVNDDGSRYFVFVDTSLTPSTTYTFSVIAKLQSNPSITSERSSLVDFTSQPPQVVFETPILHHPDWEDITSTSVALTWEDGPGNASSLMYFPVCGEIGLEPVYENTCTFTDLQPGTKYRFYVYGFQGPCYYAEPGDSYQRYVWTKSASGTGLYPPAFQPPAKSAVKYNQITIGWSESRPENATPSTPVEYYVTYAKNGVEIDSEVTEGTSFTTPANLLPGTEYTFEIFSIYNGLESLHDTMTIRTANMLTKPEFTRDGSDLFPNSGNTLSWTPSQMSDGSSGTVTYTVVTKQGSTVLSTKTTQDTQMTFTGLQDFTKYTFDISATCGSYQSEHDIIEKRTPRGGTILSGFVPVMEENTNWDWAASAEMAAKYRLQREGSTTDEDQFTAVYAVTGDTEDTRENLSNTAKAARYIYSNGVSTGGLSFVQSTTKVYTFNEFKTLVDDGKATAILLSNPSNLSDMTAARYLIVAGYNLNGDMVYIADPETGSGSWIPYTTLTTLGGYAPNIRYTGSLVQR